MIKPFYINLAEKLSPKLIQQIALDIAKNKPKKEEKTA